MDYAYRLACTPQSGLQLEQAADIPGSHDGRFQPGDMSGLAIR
jgi:hypothetical protein